MKTTFCLFIAIAVSQLAAFTQCGVNYKELLDKYCTGVYLQHQELKNSPDRKVTFLLKEGDRYALYFLNPSKKLPEFMLTGSKSSAMKDVVRSLNKKDNTSLFAFTADETGEYELTYTFGTKEDACVLMAIYLQNLTVFKPGLYRSFEEMKYNNPSALLEQKIVSRTVTIGGTPVHYYKLESNNKKSGAYYGFSDGKNIYIRPGAGFTKEYVRIDNYGKYSLFEDIAYVYTGTVSIPFLTHNIVDMNTGSIARLDRKYVRKLLADDPQLLEAFNNESGKDKKLREYVVQYLTK